MSGDLGDSGCPCARPALTEFRTECSADVRGYPWYESTFEFCFEVSVTGANGTSQKQFQPSYGESCMKHIEPGHSDCFDQNTNEELPVSGDNPRQPWCSEPWCYVDPCVCNADKDKTSRFLMADGTSIDLVYSYPTCGGEDFFSTSAEAQERSGIIQGECTQVDASGSMLNTFSLFAAGMVVAITGRSVFRMV